MPHPKMPEALERTRKASAELDLRMMSLDEALKAAIHERYGPDGVVQPYSIDRLVREARATANAAVILRDERTLVEAFQDT
jgi:hypothetical protein